MGHADAVRLALRGAADAVLSVALGPVCAACAEPLATPTRSTVCGRCWSGVRRLTPPLCRTCGDPLASWRVIALEENRCARCRRHAGAIDSGRAAADYDGPIRAIVRAYKYDGRRSLARPLAAMMAAAGFDLLRDAACVVPVPLHAWRRLQRGFNQASDLARRLDRPVVHALWRRRATTAQAGLTASARRRNVRDAFRLSPLLTRTARARLIEGVAIVLVDDVRTTGATLEACARVLKDAGAREVRALTLARATLRRP